MRYRLQRKESYAMSNVLGNHNFPVYTYRWVDIAVSNDIDVLKEYAGDLLSKDNYRIEDTRAAIADICNNKGDKYESN